MLPYFLEIETSSYCNKVCPTCIRNSSPEKEFLDSWFEHNKLPTETILEIVKQAHDLGFNGKICLSHYNEPLYDIRLSELGKSIKEIANFECLFFMTNGELLTEELANSLDGIYDKIYFTTYLPEPKRSKKQIYLQSLFNKTQPLFVPEERIITHFFPNVDLEELINNHINNPCIRPSERWLFNHKGEMLLCCDDLTGHFNLGKFPDKSLVELTENLQSYIDALALPKGRRIFSYCSSCPRS